MALQSVAVLVSTDDTWHSTVYNIIMHEHVTCVLVDIHHYACEIIGRLHVQIKSFDWLQYKQLIVNRLDVQ